MLKTLIQYQIYIIIGILVFPIFAFIVYFAKSLIDRAKFVKTLHNMKKPLMERINNVEMIYEMKEQQEEMNMIINDIKHDIDTLKQEIQDTHIIGETEKIQQIEQEVTAFYEKMHTPQPEEAKTEEPIIVQETPQEIYDRAVIQQQAYQLQVQQNQTTLQKEQVKVMNANISKFLIVYREKDKMIDIRNKAIHEKNKSIYILQQKLNEAEHRLKKFIAEHQHDKSKDSIIEEKVTTINLLQQRLQEVENKFRKIALLHKSITEKEKIKDTIIEEKNTLIANLQNKLNEIEMKLMNITTINEDNKEKLLSKKLNDIDEKIQVEKKKNRIFIILFILFLLLGIGGFMFIYTYYLQNTLAYTI